MRIAIIGSREAPPNAAKLILQHLPQEVTEIISGGARGIDTAAEQVAHELSIPMRVIRPNYRTYGKKAPLIRNADIVSSADRVLAFWNGESRGTQQAISTCIKKGIPVQIIPLAEREGEVL